MFRYVITFCGVFAVMAAANAGERFEFYNGVRSLGMGGATVATVNDETALLHNPAALGKLRNYFLTIADPELEVGANFERMAGTDVTMFLDPQETLDTAKEFPGKRFHQRAQIFPSFVVTNFGFGVYGRWSADAFVDDASTEYKYNYRNDYAFVFGFNFRLFDGIVKIGVNARGINRVESNRDDIPVATTGMDFETTVAGETLAREGFGVGTDAGLILTAPIRYLPTLAAVYRDIGKTSYNMSEGYFYTTDKRPDRTPGTIDVGLAIFPILSNTTRLSITAEMVDVMDAVEPVEDEESDEVTRRLHYGMEFNFGDVFFLRAGMNQGYWTAGIELSMANTQLQFATYGEEVSDVVEKGSGDTYTKEEDRRYVGKFSFRF